MEERIMALVLIVEDERSIRQAIQFELNDEGYDVHCASGFQEALSALRAFEYDLIISDIFLDDGNGVQLMETARKLNKKIPFIVISAFPDSDLAIQVKTVLNDRFFEKPFYAEDLKLKAEEILRDQLKTTGGFTQTEMR
jgi:DNA-binding response OmpR family regulator